MAKFNFEKNLTHQSQAVKSTVGVFDNLEIKKSVEIEKQFVNPVFDICANYNYFENIKKIQKENGIEKNRENGEKKENIIDIMMETGTGKTYTYTKTIFELNKLYGIFKFIIAVPTIPIKAGTIDFLNSDSSREHFKEQYGKTLKLHIIESKKGGKSKKSYMPHAVSNFVDAGNFDKNKIQILVVNIGMINASSKDKATGKKILTLEKSYDKTLFDKYSVPFEAISATKPFMIIDEPHKFNQKSITWKNTKKMNPQFIIRYGATFPEEEIKRKNELGKVEKIKIKDYQNLVYTLSAVDSFNKNLVKGIIGHTTEFKTGKNAIVKLINSDSKEASFELYEKNDKKEKRKKFKLIKKDSLEKIHSEMTDLVIENLNKSKVVLSDGLELKKGDKINPFSYAEKLQETMMKKAIKHHFELEKKYLTREVKIKPLTLFFIDNIKEYRNKDGYIKKTIEKYIKIETEELLKTEKNKFYKNYLKETLKNIPETHCGYFSKDNNDKDEKIEKEINEILHDKQAMLNLKNIRRFIFSKWTLKEGWDNPNIFQICKLRSSGSEISKLQEVGRGLRLPVNEYGNRVKDEQIFLNYFVDFTENDFVNKLVNEINEKSGSISREGIQEKLTDDMIKQICEKYNILEDDLLKKLDDEKIIKRNNDFEKNGFEYIKVNYPDIFDGIDSNKVRNAKDVKKKIKIRTEKYPELKELWEKINEKVILEYKIKDEKEFEDFFLDFLEKDFFSDEEIKEKRQKINIKNNKAIINEKESASDRKIISLSTMKYDDFLRELSGKLYINLKTLHQCFIKSKIEINKYLNQTTIRIFKKKFDNYLMYKAIKKFGIEYQKIKSSIHPTNLTNKKGEIKKEINSSDIGVNSYIGKVAEKYIFDELFADSALEAENIKTNIDEVIIFSKIPKNSIRIPVAGGKSYSPDFAYVLKSKDGNKKINFIVETKNTDEESLREEEKQKIKYAEKFFGNKIKVIFKTQFNGDEIGKLIKNIYDKK